MRRGGKKIVSVYFILAGEKGEWRVMLYCDGKRYNRERERGRERERDR